MEPDPYDSPRPGSKLGRPAKAGGRWLRRHPLGALQILLLILVLVVIAQNLEPTSIDLLFWTVAALPKLVLMLLSMVVGALVWEGLRRRWLKPGRRHGATPKDTGATSQTRP